MKIAIFTALTLAAASAAADGITVGNVDTDVVVTLHGIHAINPQVRSNGDKIELDVADESPAQILLPNDQTVRKIEVSSGAHARATLQIKHSAKTTELMARATKVSENGEDLVLVIPRESKYAIAKLTAESAAAPAPPAAVAATVTAPVAVTAPVPAPVPVPVPAPVPVPVPAAAPTTPAPAPTATAAAIPAPAAATAPVAQPALQLAEPPHLPMGSIAVIVLFGGAGAFFFWNKRRRGAAPQAKHSIDVLASRSLGGKTRIVLIAVDENELLLSVSDTGGARLLGSWPTNDAPAEDDWRAATATPREDWRNATATPRLAEAVLPAPVGIAPPRQMPAAPASAARGTVDFGTARSSPSVSGILRLKLNAAGSGQHATADEGNDDDNGDAGRDAAWVRELVNAARKSSRA